MNHWDEHEHFAIETNKSGFGDTETKRKNEDRIEIEEPIKRIANWTKRTCVQTMRKANSIASGFFCDFSRKVFIILIF